MILDHSTELFNEAMFEIIGQIIGILFVVIYRILGGLLRIFRYFTSLFGCFIASIGALMLLTLFIVFIKSFIGFIKTICFGLLLITLRF